MTIDSDCKMHLLFFSAVLAPGRLHPNACACTPRAPAIRAGPLHVGESPARVSFASHTHARGQQLQQVTTTNGYANIQKRDGVADAKLAPGGADIETKVR